MDYKQLAAVILEKVGGKENVDKLMHCANRLRFTLRDVSKADTEGLKKTKGVMSVINAGGQYQVVIGPDVPQVYQEVIALGVESGTAAAPAKEVKKKEQSKLSAVLEKIASMFQPIIPAITGAGLLKALMALFSVMGVLGITEPVLYGVNLKFIYPLISAMIGGGVGGLYLGITGVGRYASGSPPACWSCRPTSAAAA